MFWVMVKLTDCVRVRVRVIVRLMARVTIGSS